MSSGNEYERLFKLWASVAKLVVDGRRSATKVADALQAIVSETLELYLAPGQRDGGSMTGFELEKHLEGKKLIDRTFSLDDERVKEWIANPSSYPEEFKGKAVFLWKSQKSSGDNRSLAYLIWHDGRVVVDWDWLEDRWNGNNPVLLASS